MIEKEILMWAVRRLASSDPEERTLAAATIGEIKTALGPYSSAVAGMLVVVATAEDVEACYERQLDSLAELTVHTTVPPQVVDPLRDVRKGYVWEDEYLDEILDNVELDARASELGQNSKSL